MGMGTEMVLREAVPDDAEAIAAMYQETWPLYWATVDDVRFQFEVLSRIGGQVLVALCGERVVGHCEFIPTHEPPPYGYWGYLEALEVHRGFQRRGIGTALVREAIRRCSELGCAWFGTSPDDERSEGLYRKVGMTHVDRRLVTEFEIHGEVPAPAVGAAEELGVVERPWATFLHVLGRLHCAPYWWAMTFRRREANESSAGAGTDLPANWHDALSGAAFHSG
ncbi:MAG: GNAT family N-acetyltransferase [Armatimonadetes bacterium]|nr:GNAT family N-acetyltransferase [Armatimonadota bacterium]